MHTCADGVSACNNVWGIYNITVISPGDQIRKTGNKGAKLS